MPFTPLKNPDVTVALADDAPYSAQRIAEALLICRYARLLWDEEQRHLAVDFPGRSARYLLTLEPAQFIIQAYRIIDAQAAPLPRETFEAVLLGVQWAVLTIRPVDCDEAVAQYNRAAVALNITVPASEGLTLFACCGEG